MANQYDVIIVGARCAGAALAAHLGRASVRVLLLDSAKLPSDHVLSTHYLQPPGAAALEELGLGEQLRRSAPATRRFAASADGATLISTLPADTAGYCIRRFKLDAWLAEAATNAGAELRDRSRVAELTWKNDRVTGVVVETPSGRETISADLVVGADGVHSTVAKQTKVEEYLGSDSTRGGYWFYFPENEAWRRPDREWDGLISYEGDGLRYVFNADDNLLLMVAAPPLREIEAWGRDYRAKTLAYLGASPLIAPLLEGVEPVGKGAGALGQRLFYRRPVGPGFALVGDAGNFKDFVTGHGMTDALLGAKRLATAVLDGREEAYQHYWRERDASSLPLYFDAQRLGEVGANDALTRLIFAKLAASPELRDRPGLVADRRISPFDMVPTLSLVSWVLGAVLRGRLDVVAPFFKTGKRIGEFQREIAERQALHAEARRALDEAPSTVRRTAAEGAHAVPTSAGAHG